DELPGFEDSRHVPRHLMLIALGDVLAAMALIVATLALGVWVRTTGALAGGVALAFTVYLGVMALSGTWIALRNLSAARRLQASDKMMDAVPVVAVRARPGVGQRGIAALEDDPAAGPKAAAETRHA